MTDSNLMEVITGAEAPEYLKRPYVQNKEEDTAITMEKDEEDVAVMMAGKIQSTITKPQQGKEPEKIRNDHKRLEKGSKDFESETESEKINTISSHVPILSQGYQTVQVWFGRKKRSPRGKKEEQKELIKAKQIQETPIENLQDNSIEDIENIEDIEDIEDIEESEAMECVETQELPKIEPEEPSNG